MTTKHLDSNYATAEELFDVTVKQSIGTVYKGDYSGIDPYEAAMTLIGRYGKDGVFEFPHLGYEEGEMVRVTVEGMGK